MNYYAVVFLLRPPDLLRCGPFPERENVCNSQENDVRTRCAAIVNHRAIVKILRVVNLLRVVFLARRGPLGFVGLQQQTCLQVLRGQASPLTCARPLVMPKLVLCRPQGTESLAPTEVSPSTADQPGRVACCCPSPRGLCCGSPLTSS